MGPYHIPWRGGRIFLPVHTSKERLTVFSFLLTVPLRFLFLIPNTHSGMSIVMAPFLGKGRRRLGCPGLQFWPILCRTEPHPPPFLSSSQLFSSGLVCILSSSFVLSLLSFSSLWRQLFPINPCLFSLNCSVILSFFFHDSLSAFLLSIWATWFSLFLNEDKGTCYKLQSPPAPGSRKAQQRVNCICQSFQHFYYISGQIVTQLEIPWLVTRTIGFPGFHKGNLVVH